MRHLSRIALITMLFLQHIRQVGKAISMPASWFISFAISHSDVQVEGLDWIEPVLVWVAVCMPTGSGKSTLCKFLRNVVKRARTQCAEDDGPSWLSDDQSFEKLGEVIMESYSVFMTNFLCSWHRSMFVEDAVSLTPSKSAHFCRCMDQISGCGEPVSYNSLRKLNKLQSIVL